MNYFKYLLKNKLLWFLAFFAIASAFVWYSQPERYEVRIVAIFCGAMFAAFLVGNFIAWRKVK